MALQAQFEIVNCLGTPMIEDFSTRDDVISTSEYDPLWKLIEAQEEILMGKLLIVKVSNDYFINRRSEKFLWQNVDSYSEKYTAEIGRKNLRCYDQILYLTTNKENFQDHYLTHECFAQI